MPNWCDNTLTIEGESEDAKRIINAFKDLDPFDKIHPTPKELYDNDAHSYSSDPTERTRQDARRSELRDKYGYASAYDWHVGEWGTKWDVEPYVMESSETSISVSFDSAWSPPIELYKWINRNYPEIKMSWTYEEGGVGFQGEGYCYEDTFVDETSDFVYEEEEFIPPDLPVIQVGSATVLPLPKGNKK
jgi:hypothetical protein